MSAGSSRQGNAFVARIPWDMQAPNCQDIIHRPVFVTNMTFQRLNSVRLQVKPTQLGPIDRASPYPRLASRCTWLQHSYWQWINTRRLIFSNSASINMDIAFLVRVHQCNCLKVCMSLDQTFNIICNTGVIKFSVLLKKGWAVEDGGRIITLLPE
jgi:hypothetical protein